MNNKYYDGIEQFKKLCEVQESDDAILKFCRYRNYNAKSPSIGDQIDIDVSEWAVDMYSEKYGFLKYAEKEKQVRNICGKEVNFKYKFQLSKGEDDVYIGDTIVSFGSILKQYVNIDKLFEDNVKSISQVVNKFLNAPDVVIYRVDNRIKELAAMIRTKGNLIPIPMFFNVERSGIWANCDHWDLVMFAVYNWYTDNKNDEHLKLLLNRYGNNKNIDLSIRYCKQWLGNFKDWKDFVDSNYLQPYVDERYEPIELWEGHFNGRLLTDLTDREEFLQAVGKMTEIAKERNGYLQTDR